jgi:hypothetical protein
MHGHMNVKLVHLVGFVIRIYHDARSHERQRNYLNINWYKNYLFHIKYYVLMNLHTACLYLSAP